MSNADHQILASPPLRSGEIAAMSAKFAEGYARIREVTDTDGACAAWYIHYCNIEWTMVIQ